MGGRYGDDEVGPARDHAQSGVSKLKFARVRARLFDDEVLPFHPAVIAHRRGKPARDLRKQIGKGSDPKVLAARLRTSSKRRGCQCARQQRDQPASLHHCPPLSWCGAGHEGTPSVRSTARLFTYQYPPPHSITSSAAAISVGGNVRPSDLAVRRLRASSKRVGCVT